MSKYNIFVESIVAGHVFLDALNFQYYLFLNKDNIPSETTRTYIEEAHQNQIGSCQFKFAQLRNTRGQIEKEGWALTQPGPVPNSQRWPVVQFNKICAEQTYSVREFEPILGIKLNTGDRFTTAETAADNFSNCGFFNMAFSYVLFFKSLKTPLEQKNSSSRDASEYTFFKASIPSNATIIEIDEFMKTHTPETADRENYPPEKYSWIPYSFEKLAILQNICTAGGNLYQDLKTVLIDNKMEINLQDKYLFIGE